MLHCKTGANFTAISAWCPENHALRHFGEGIVYQIFGPLLQFAGLMKRSTARNGIAAPDV
jgi:hypothetical protein